MGVLYHEGGCAEWDELWKCVSWKGGGGCFEGSGFERNDLRIKGVGKSFIFMGVSNIGVR